MSVFCSNSDVPQSKDEYPRIDVLLSCVFLGFIWLIYVWDYYGCGGGDHNDVAERAYRKRRRVSENQEIEDRLESLILRVGEKVLLLLSLNL
jgi:hypothetical protein